MRPEMQSSRPCRVIRGLRPYSAQLDLLVCFLLILLATTFAGAIFRGFLIWIANGVLLAYLLLAPRSRWPAYLGAALLGHVLGTALIHAGWPMNLISAPLDLFEPLLGAILLRRRSAQLPRFTDRRYLLRFFLFAIVIAPVASAVISATLQALLLHADFGVAFIQWSASDSLGTCIGTPACVAIFRTRLRRTFCSPQQGLKALPVLLIAVAILSQSYAPVPFLLYPLLILVLLHLGLGWAVLCTLFIATVGSWFTVHGLGPFAGLQSTSSIKPDIVFQLFLACAIFMLYSISIVIEDLRATQRRLQETAAIHKLVMENSRDVIIIADFEGRRSFVSAAGDLWGGWNRDELRNRNSLALIHPDDRSRVASVIQTLRTGKDGALVECRVQRRDQSYVWVEASMRAIRDPNTGVPTGVLESVREITARKSAEQQLAEAYHTVETLAITDALTGLANRRRFDQCMNTEWRRAMRDRKPLSLLLIDADYFKSFNDSYGHLRGDRCLKQVAGIAQRIVSRPADLVARFGGEEFAVILPGTGSRGARQIADSIRAAIQHCQLTHASNPAGVVTVSIGCATLIPQMGQSGTTLIEYADRALYHAKRTGRNRVSTDDMQDDSGRANAETEHAPWPVQIE